MKKNTYLLCVELLLLLCTSMANAENAQNITKYDLMTVRDIKTNSFSNITIQNKTGEAITVYGLYINTFADNTPVPHDCTAPNDLYSAQILYPSYPVAAGAFVTPIALAKNQKVPIGKNYLYNMIYTAIFFRKNITPLPSMPCRLPGCGWSTITNDSPTRDIPGVEWCIYLGVLAPAAGNSTTSNVPPMANLVNNDNPEYKYDLVKQYGYIGPISCDDKTLTCSVSTAQNVAFPQ